MMLDKPLMVYDGDCSFCKVWIDYWKRLTGDRVDYAPFQEVADQFPHIPRENFDKAVYLIMPDGTAYKGAQAVCESLQHHPYYWLFNTLYKFLPGFATVTEGCYQTVAENRDILYKLTRRLWGERIPTALIPTRWLIWPVLGMIAVLFYVFRQR
jgi:predicted DCC family thiol-disulfide oxidoreductase YuxK